MLIAKPEILTEPSVPEGIKMFFRDYAAEKEVVGHRLLVISLRTFWNHEDHQRYHGKHAGVGPGHTLNHQPYEKHMPLEEDRREGVPKGTKYPMGLYTWIERHLKHGGKLVTRLYEVGERSETCAIDDD